MAFNYFQENSVIGSNTTNLTTKDKRYDLTKGHLNPVSDEAFVVTALNESTITLSGGTYKVFLGGGGGGGSSYADYSGNAIYGGYGGIFWFEAYLPYGSYEVGVGAGGQNNNAVNGITANPALNSNTYVMRGGAGSVGGLGHSSGSGGGGSYLKTNFTISQANWNNYLGIVGGGGAAATHGFTSNSGGHGFGVGGTSWSANYPNSTYAGKNGFDGNNGTGGTSPTSSSNLNGGSSSVQDQLFGGAAHYYGSGHNGGAGGGGAGGGSAGSGGDNNRGTQTNINGGYISTTTTTNGYTTEVVPRGGGGGGGHNNDCGGTGAGGGVLLFTAYTNSWDATVGNGIPHWTGTNRQQGSYTASAADGGIAAYTAYGDLQTYTQTYFGTDLTGSGQVLFEKCKKGTYTTAGNHGFVVIATKDTSVTPTYIT